MRQRARGNTMIYFHFAKFPSLFWPWAMPGEKAKRRWEDKWKQLLLFPCASWPALCKHVLATLPSPRRSLGAAQACPAAGPEWVPLELPEDLGMRVVREATGWIQGSPSKAMTFP